MAQHHLHRSEISTTCQQVGGKGVAEYMRTDRLVDTGTKGDLTDYLPETVSGHGDAPVGDEEHRGGLAFEDQRACPFDILLDANPGGSGKGDDPLLVALAEDANVTTAQAAAVHRQVDQLGNAQPRGIKQVQHGIVAQHEG